MLKTVLIILCAISTNLAFASTTGKYYGPDLCKHPDYKCIKLSRTVNWKRLYPDERQREIVQKVNRTYNYLYRGKVLVVPKNLETITLLDVSPFPRTIEDPKEKVIIVDQEKLAWGAYEADGSLVKWGPVSSGKDFCPDIGRRCRTLTGVFRIFDKQDKRCRSRQFSARMPYCMFFYKGFALHGSKDIPGKRASHGCVRMFIQDAKWLNHNFVSVSREKNDYTGTKVIIKKLYDDMEGATKKSKKYRKRRRR